MLDQEVDAAEVAQSIETKSTPARERIRGAGHTQRRRPPSTSGSMPACPRAPSLAPTRRGCPAAVAPMLGGDHAPPRTSRRTRSGRRARTTRSQARARREAHHGTRLQNQTQHPTHAQHGRAITTYRHSAIARWQRRPANYLATQNHRPRHPQSSRQHHRLRCTPWPRSRP